MSKIKRYIDVDEGLAYIDSNFPNDPLLRAIGRNLLQQLPATYIYNGVALPWPPPRPEEREKPPHMIGL